MPEFLQVSKGIMIRKHNSFTSKDLCAASALLRNSSMEVFSVMETGAEIGKGNLRQTWYGGEAQR